MTERHQSLRYRYYSWLDIKLSELNDIIEDTPKSIRGKYAPQKEYTLGDQFLLGFAVVLFAIAVPFSCLKRKLEGLSDKLTVRSA